MNETGELTSSNGAAVGSNMTPTHGVVIVLVTSAVVLISLGYIFRK